MSHNNQIEYNDKTELKKEIEKGIKDIENDNVYSADFVFAEIEKLL